MEINFRQKIRKFFWTVTHAFPLNTILIQFVSQSAPEFYSYSLDTVAFGMEYKHDQYVEIAECTVREGMREVGRRTKQVVRSGIRRCNNAAIQCDLRRVTSQRRSRRTIYE